MINIVLSTNQTNPSIFAWNSSLKTNYTTMNLRAGISILITSISLVSAQAQTERNDTLLQKRNNEIHINQEALKSIEFNFLPQTEIMKHKPKMDERKPWMDLRKDLPISLTDTTIIGKKYIRMLPYSIWEYDDSHLSYQTGMDTLTIRIELNPEKIKPLPGMGHGYIVLPAGMDQSVTPSNHPLGGFNADKALYETFTKRGRAIKRNRKRAKAWKIYNDYVPTKEDSLKWYGNKKRIPKNTPTIPVDSINDHYFMNTK